MSEVVAQDAGYTLIKLPSTEVRRVSQYCVGNYRRRYQTKNIASLPLVRQVAHVISVRRPKTRGSQLETPLTTHTEEEKDAHHEDTSAARTKQGRPTGKGQKTRSPKKYSNVFIVTKRKPGKLMRNGGK
jgi:large subunit ribosomal protein L2